MKDSTPDQLPPTSDQSEKSNKSRIQRIQIILKASLLEILAEAKAGREDTTSPSRKTLLEALKLRIKGTLKTQLKQWPERYKQLQRQAAQLDFQLSERYGDPYTAMKQRGSKVATWYKALLLAGQKLESEQRERRQAATAVNVSSLGAKMAQKEDALKQKIRHTVKTITVSTES